MKDLFLTASIEKAISSNPLDLLEMISIACGVEILKDKYKKEYNITDNLGALAVTEDKEGIEMIKVLTSISVGVFDGLLLPTDYKKYKDLVEYSKIAKDNDRPVYLFDMDKLTITREDDKLNESKETKKSVNNNNNGSTTCQPNIQRDKKVQSKTDKLVQPTIERRVEETTVFQFVDGDAEISYSERNGEKTITVYHQGKATKYKI